MRTLAYHGRDVERHHLQWRSGKLIAPDNATRTSILTYRGYTSGINPYHQPVSTAVINVPAGATVTAEVRGLATISDCTVADRFPSGTTPSTKSPTTPPTPLTLATRDPSSHTCEASAAPTLTLVSYLISQCEDSGCYSKLRHRSAVVQDLPGRTDRVRPVLGR